MRGSFFLIAAAFLSLAPAVLSGCQTTGKDDGASAPVAETSRTATQNKNAIEVVIGMNASQVSQAMGAADSVGQDAQGRETWIYNSRRANYVYSADRDGKRTMIIDGLGAAGSMPTYIVITFDPGKRVVDFTYQQRAF